MSDSLPPRARCGNNAADDAAPALFTLIATRPQGRDGTAIVLRDTIVADTRHRAVRLAACILPGLRSRYGAATDVQLFDLSGCPVFLSSEVIQ